MNKRIVGFVAVVAMLGMASCGALLVEERDALPVRTFQEGREAAMKPYLSFFGPNSGIESPEFVRVTEETAWNELWRRHLGAEKPAGLVTPSIPRINFDECMVIGVFSGEGSNCDGHYVVSIEDVGGAVRLRYDSHTYQTASLDGSSDGGAVRAHPFGLFVVPRSEKTYIIEKNVQGLIGHDPIWKEKHRFTAID